MAARLDVVAGPFQGSSVALEGGPAFVGRDSACLLCLPDATLSRRHASIAPDGSGWILHDLGSLNGLRVNGVAASDRRLEDGDRIELGSSTVVFREDHAAPEAPGEAAEGPDPGATTLRLPAERAVWAAPPERTPEPGDRAFATLLSATRRFAEARTEDELARALLEAALAAVPAAAGAVLVPDEDGRFRSAASSHRNGVASLSVSRTAAALALARREAIVFRRDAPPAGGTVPDSFLSTGADALVAVPLLGAGEARGVLELESGTGRRGFTEDHVQLLFGLAASAASALAVVRHVAWLEGEHRRLGAAVAPDDEMLGESPGVARVRALINRAGASEATVLLLGESGTGKELAARAVHARSPRRGGPFVAVNAAALVDTLVESELFGHERGAFTGAVARRKGRLEAADRGTLFLDEIAEMALPAQAKLLRVLETRTFERVGGGTVKVDVRLVAATNRDLLAEVRAGRFREDLYYRLNVVSIALPPLRERRDDIPTLASAFLARQAERLGKRFDGFSPAALARLVAYPWPGNVRELANAVERAAVLGEGGLVRPEDLPEALLEGPAEEAGAVGVGPYHDAVNRAKRQAVAAAMAEARGNVTEAARLLGLHPNYLHRLLNQLGLR